MKRLQFPASPFMLAGVMDHPTFTLANGDRIPAIGLGTWKSEPGQVAAAVLEAIKIGYRHIDCAPIYENEAEIGEALQQAFDSGLVGRDDLWLTSKLWNSCHHPENVLPAIKQTLSDLRIDRLDLFLMHWPVALRPGLGIGFPASGADFLAPGEVPIEDTWAAMEEAVDAGLCRNIGLSNFNPKKMRRVIEGGRIQPMVNQVECHPLLAQDGLLAACREAKVVLTAYSPLGSSDRPPRVFKDSDPVLLEDPRLAELAAKHGATPAQVALAWAVKRGTCVIPKSVRPARLRENLESARVPLDDADMELIAGINRDLRFIDGAIWTDDNSPYTLEWLWEK